MEKMKWIKKGISALLALNMVLSSVPLPVFAVTEDNLCEHHPVHTAECHYAEAVEGSPCTHVHDEACGYAEPIVEVLCACTETDDTGALVHTEGCGYVAPVAGADCTHSHDELCGYVEAVEGQPCGYECAECASAARITGVSITVDGVLYTEGNVTITPDTQSIIVTATGTNFANASNDNFVQYADGAGYTLSSGYWTIDTAANTATLDLSANISWFDSCDNFEIQYCNDWQSLESWQNTGIFLTYYDDVTVTIDTGASVTLRDADRDDYYEISTADELYAFAAAVNGGDNAINGELTTDIVVNENVLTADGSLNGDGSNFRAWTPIGNDTYAYIGTFDGGGHTISGLYFNDSTAYYVGLFGCLESGSTVKNIRITDSYICAPDCVGGVVGRVFGGTVENCSNAGTVSGTDNVGGVVGKSNGTVIGCSNAGTVSGTGNHVGGVTGYSDGTMTGCYNTGAVSGYAFVGGVAGNSDGTMTGCYNTGAVTGYNVGGVAGYSGGTMTGCYNTGTVTGTGNVVGGVVGDNMGTVGSCYNTGTVSGTGSYVGGVVGNNDSVYGTVASCYYLDTAADGGIKGGDVTGRAEAKTAEQFASGEVAYLLGSPFGQDIGTDATPNFTGGTVYQVKNCKEENDYSNINENIGHQWVNGTCTVCDLVCGHTGGTTKPTDNGNGTHSVTCTVCGGITEVHTFDGNGTCVCGVNLFDDSDSTLTIDGTLGGKTEATEEDITVLVNKIKECVDSGITTITVTGSEPAMIDMGSWINTAIGEAIYRLGDDESYDGKIDLILPDVKEIVDEEFYNAYALNSITLPKVTTVGDGAFSGCFYLRKMTFGSVVTSINQKDTYVFLVGEYVDGCDLVLNCGQMQAEYTYIPDLENNVWFKPSWGGDVTWKSITLTHTEGTAAACTTKAVCSVCGESYGEVGGHTPAEDATYTDNGDGTHSYTCTDCKETVAEDHTGGTATCTTQAKCEHCGASYGEVDTTNHDSTVAFDSNGFCENGCYEPAADSNADGVYEIANAGQLYWFAAQVNSGEKSINAVLMHDIDLTNHTWTPIGVTAMGEGVTDGYTGTFDGQGHVISNITFATPTSAMAAGIFGTVQSGGTVKNLGVENLTFDNNDYDHRAGGIAGQLLADSTISDCYVINSTVKASSRVVGGIVGMNKGTVKNCYTYNMTLAAYNNRFGGISGDYSGGKLENCYTDYSALASSQAGTATNCEAGVSAERFASGEIAYALGDGWGQTIGTDPYPVLYGAEVYRFDTCKNEREYSNTYKKDGHQYENGICTVCGGYEPATDSNADGVYEISNAGQLYWFAAQVNSGSTAINGELTADIVVNENVLTADGSLNGDGSNFRAWTPIGNNSNRYTGEFRGNEHTVSGLYFNGSADYVGLFGYVGNGDTVQVGSDGTVLVGSGGTVQNVGVIDSYLDGGSYVGGVVGYNDISGTVQYVYNTGNIQGSSQYVGGVVGRNQYIVRYAYNTGTVSAQNYAGGVVGHNNYILEYAYNTGSASDWYNYYVGVTGYNRDSTKLKNCYYLADSETDELDGTTAKTADQFEIGEVAYLLNGDQSTIVFKQTLGEDGDAAPNFTGGTVYQVTNCKSEVVYSNTNENIDHNWVDGTCTVCGEVCGHTGGTATCIAQAVCTVCGESYGEVDKTNHDETVAYENGFCPICDACEPATDSNADGVYEIGNAGQLYWFAAQVNSGNSALNAILTDDITVNEGVPAEMAKDTPDTSSFRAWTPIGNESYAYTGTFDGGGHTISGLYFNDSTASYVGLFGYLGSGGTVQNVGVIDSYFYGYRYVGGVTSYNYGTVENCYNTGTVSGYEDYVGGVVGNNYGTVENCYNAGTVRGHGYVGGVVGNNYGTVENCYNAGTVSGTSYVGGAVGENSGTVTNCYNAGTVSGNGYVGGVASYNYGTVENCYNTGAVIGFSIVGGVAGTNKGSVGNCYNTGAVRGEYDVGGVVGDNWSEGTVGNCWYLDTAADGGVNGADVTGLVEARTAAQFASGEVAWMLNGDQSTIVFKQTIGTDACPSFTGDTVYYGYTSCADNAVIGYTNDPNASAEKPDHSTTAANDKAATCTTKAYCSVCQSEYGEVDKTNHDETVAYENGFCPNGCYEPAELVGSYYQITNAGQLYWFAAQVNSGYTNINGELKANIVVNENVLTADGEPNGDGSEFRLWTPIGTEDNAYIGDFCGLEHTVSGLYFNDSTANFVGLFGYVGSGTVNHVGVIDSYFYGYSYVGGVAGNNNGTVENCYNAGTVSGGSGYVGGVAGDNSGTVTNCYNIGSVSARGLVGGVVGSNNNNCTVSNCYNAGTVSGSSNYVGGVVGENSGTVTGCYNTGTVSGTNFVGGVAGYNWTAVTNCYNTGSVSGEGWVGGVAGWNRTTVTNCYNTGTVSGTTDVGGVVGLNANDLGPATVTNCYFDSTVYSSNAIGTNDGTATNVEGKSTEQFASGEVAYLLSQGENGSIWGQTIGTDDTPNFTGGTVYQVTNCRNETVYSNTNENIDHNWENGVCTYECGTTHDPHTFENGICTVCGASQTVVSVDISWGAMEFTYTDGEWQPESHTYAEGEWTPDADGSNVITVKNNGNVAVNAAFAYTKTVEAVSGSFTLDGTNPITEVALEVNGKKEIYLLLTGKPNETNGYVTLGTITVTITTGGE